MEFQSYLQLFDTILKDQHAAAPYDDPEYKNFTKLNQSRMNRWLKHGIVSEHVKKVIQNIDQPQTWIIITEPWCGDAAHIAPILHLLASTNPKMIKEQYELRDNEPFRINHYLTNGKSKSIPILVVQDKDGKDLFHWGPRPAEAQKLFQQLKDEGKDQDAIHVAIQNWYNENNANQIQQEISKLISAHK